MERLDRVVCIFDFSKSYTHLGRQPVALPVKDEIYHILDFIVCPCGCGCKAISLQELWRNDYFGIECFRPVDESFGEQVCEKIEQECKEEIKEYLGIFQIYKIQLK